MRDNTSQERGSTTHTQRERHTTIKAQQPINNRNRYRSKQASKIQQTRTKEHNKSSENKQGQQHEHEQKITKARTRTRTAAATTTTTTTRNKNIQTYMSIKKQCAIAGKISHKQVPSLYHHQNLCSTCFSIKCESSLFELHVKRGSHDPR